VVSVSLRSESVVGPLCNLACSEGHRYFSPTPTKWAGQLCRPWRNAEGGRCERKLRLIPRAKRR